MKNDLSADLTADLLSDLGRPAPAPAPPLPSAPLPRATPALHLSLTPLRWSLPSFDPTERGRGLAVRVGPLRVELAL